MHNLFQLVLVIDESEIFSVPQSLVLLTKVFHLLYLIGKLWKIYGIEIWPGKEMVGQPMFNSRGKNIKQCLDLPKLLQQCYEKCILNAKSLLEIYKRFLFLFDVVHLCIFQHTPKSTNNALDVTAFAYFPRFALLSAWVFSLLYHQLQKPGRFNLYVPSVCNFSFSQANCLWNMVSNCSQCPYTDPSSVVDVQMHKPSHMESNESCLFQIIYQMWVGATLNVTRDNFHFSHFLPPLLLLQLYLY